MNILTDDELAKFPLPDYPKKLVDMKRDIAEAAHRETLKMVLDIVNKHWAGYCDFEDKRACLEILENIQDDIEALTQSGEE